MKKISSFIKDYRFQSLFFRNLVLITAILLVPLAFISAILVGYSQKLFHNEMESVCKGNANRIGRMLESVYTDLYSSMLMVEVERDTYLFLVDSPLYQSYASSYEDAIEKQLRSIKIGKDYVSSIKVYSLHSGKVVTQNGTWVSEEELAFLQSLPQNFTDKVLFVPNLNVDYPKVVSVVLPVTQSQNQLDGYILIDVNSEKLGKYLMQDEENTNQLYLFNPANVLLYCKDRDLIFSQREDLSLPSLEKGATVFSENGHEWLAVQYNASRWGFSLVYCEDTQTYQALNRQLRNNVGLILIAAALISVAAVAIISYKTYQPIQKITNALKQFEKDELKIADDTLPPQNEMVYIMNTIMRSRQKTDDLTAELQKRIQLLNRAQTMTFQAQITPHFIYNTLDTFKWKAMELSGGNNELSRSISKFSKLLRISIDGTQRLVKLSEELEHAALYLDVLKIRYEDKILVKWEVDESCRECMLPKLSLQPLIENAVYHGIKPKSGMGTITICAKKQDDSLIVSIEDDGIGMQPEELQTLRQAIKETDFVLAKHVGVRNVNQRIKLIFGEDYGVYVDSILEKGTRVSLKLPLVDIEK